MVRVNTTNEGNSSIRQFLPNSVVILDGILKRLEESFETTVGHGEIVNLSTENEFVIQSTQSSLLEISTGFNSFETYIHIIQIHIHIQD